VRATRLVLIAWGVLIVLLIAVELAEITHLFTLPVESALGDPLVFVLALVFTTVVAIVGAIFIGIYISARILSPGGFTPFEEEMLRMRTDLRDVKAAVEAMRAGDPPNSPKPPSGEAP
jgi:hypothetical protein